MSSNTLDELGRTILEAGDGGRIDVDVLEAEYLTSREELEERLSQLVDNALIRKVGDGEYELTENGVRVLDATPAGARDNRIDTPEHIDRAIEEFDLSPDEESAVRDAFSFLRYWGEATTAEIIDGAYSEEPAQYESADKWWDACVSDRLAALPDVDAPEDESNGGRWRYAGEAEVETPDRDGREVQGATNRSPPFGSVRHGLEVLDVSDAERMAARTAFAVLRERGRATAAELADAVYDEHSAGYESSDAWATWLCEVFDDLPNLDRSDGDAADGVVWTYDSTDESE